MSLPRLPIATGEWTGLCAKPSHAVHAVGWRSLIKCTPNTCEILGIVGRASAKWQTLQRPADCTALGTVFQIAHARAEGGGGKEGKNGLAKLARFLKSLGMFGGISHI